MIELHHLVVQFIHKLCNASKDFLNFYDTSFLAKIRTKSVISEKRVQISGGRECQNILNFALQSFCINPNQTIPKKIAKNSTQFKIIT